MKSGAFPEAVPYGRLTPARPGFPHLGQGVKERPEMIEMRTEEVLAALPHGFPVVLIDRVLELQAGKSIAALKNVTFNESYFRGHFPGNPVMPGVLILEALAQACGLLILKSSEQGSIRSVSFVGVDAAKFRRPVFPGDQLRLRCEPVRRRGAYWKMRGQAFVEEDLAAEAGLFLAEVKREGAEKGTVCAKEERLKIHPSAVMGPDVELGKDVEIGPYCIIQGRVKVGRGTRMAAHVFVEGDVEIGEDCRMGPFVTVGTPPQDLKYRGETTRVVIGDRNIFREYVNINRGTSGGGGVTTIGNDNFVMAYAHIAHDCHIGDSTILANAATLAGHVLIEDFSTVGAFSGIHQFCRIGRYAFVGGYSVITKDAFPYCKTVGNRPKIYGLNSIGLRRRGFTPERLGCLKKIFRIFFQSKLNTSQAIERIRAELEPTEDLQYILDFVATSKRGIIKR